MGVMYHFKCENEVWIHVVLHCRQPTPGVRSSTQAPASHQVGESLSNAQAFVDANLAELNLPIKVPLVEPLVLLWPETVREQPIKDQ